MPPNLGRTEGTDSEFNPALVSRSEEKANAQKRHRQKELRGFRDRHTGPGSENESAESGPDRYAIPRSSQKNTLRQDINEQLTNIAQEEKEQKESALKAEQAKRKEAETDEAWRRVDYEEELDAEAEKVKDLDEPISTGTWAAFDDRNKPTEETWQAFEAELAPVESEPADDIDTEVLEPTALSPAVSSIAFDSGEETGVFPLLPQKIKGAVSRLYDDPNFHKVEHSSSQKPPQRAEEKIVSAEARKQQVLRRDAQKILVEAVNDWHEQGAPQTTRPNPRMAKKLNSEGSQWKDSDIDNWETVFPGEELPDTADDTSSWGARMYSSMSIRSLRHLKERYMLSLMDASSFELKHLKDQDRELGPVEKPKIPETFEGKVSAAIEAVAQLDTMLLFDFIDPEDFKNAFFTGGKAELEVTPSGALLGRECIYLPAFMSDTDLTDLLSTKINAVSVKTIDVAPVVQIYSSDYEEYEEDEAASAQVTQGRLHTTLRSEKPYAPEEKMLLDKTPFGDRVTSVPDDNTELRVEKAKGEEEVQVEALQPSVEDAASDTMDKIIVGYLHSLDNPWDPNLLLPPVRLAVTGDKSYESAGINHVLSKSLETPDLGERSLGDLVQAAAKSAGYASREYRPVFISGYTIVLEGTYKGRRGYTILTKQDDSGDFGRWIEQETIDARTFDHLRARDIKSAKNEQRALWS